MSQLPGGTIRGEDRPDLIPEHDPVLGYCVQRGALMTGEECLDCFTDYRTPYEWFEHGNRRMNCVAVNIRKPHDGDRDAAAERFRRLMRCLTDADCRAALCNMFEAAYANPKEHTSLTFFKQIQAHADQPMTEALHQQLKARTPEPEALPI